MTSNSLRSKAITSRHLKSIVFEFGIKFRLELFSLRLQSTLLNLENGNFYGWPTDLLQTLILSYDPLFSLLKVVPLHVNISEKLLVARTILFTIYWFASLVFGVFAEFFTHDSLQVVQSLRVVTLSPPFTRMRSLLLQSFLQSAQRLPLEDPLHFKVTHSFQLFELVLQRDALLVQTQLRHHVHHIVNRESSILTVMWHQLLKWVLALF